MNLEDVPWATLRHAYGPASDVPNLLRDLVSREEERRMDAFGQLCGNVWHQGSVYEATPYVVSFLIEYLHDPTTPEPGLVALLLASIACGTGYFTRHVPVTFSRSRWEEVASKMGRSLEDLVAEEGRIVSTIRTACRDIIPDLLPYLNYSVAEVRLTVVEAFACYPEHRQKTVPAIRALQATETDEEVLQQICSTLESLEIGEPA